jgi:hypothetical protein
MDGALSITELADLLNPASPKKLKRWVMYRGSSVKHPWPTGASELIGTMQGNVGTPKRSRKGRTYHAPNGSRRYEVVGYQVITGEEVTCYMP